jgi:hypothetical protein
MTDFSHRYLESLYFGFMFVWKWYNRYGGGMVEALKGHGRGILEAYMRHRTSMKIARNEKAALFTENGRVAGAPASM